MTTEELKSKIWNFKKGISDESHKCFWKNIMISLSTIDNAVKRFNEEPNPEIGIGYSKLVVMEIWTIRELFTALGVSVEELDSTFKDIKKFRDSYAHIKERLQGREKPFRQPQRNLKWEKLTLANGKLSSTDGRGWNANNVTRLFNCEFNGDKGAMSIFGIVDNFLICNSGDKILEIEIDNSMMNSLITIVNNSLPV